MTAEDLCMSGAALLGYGWRRKMAQALGVNYSTVKRWASGESPVPVYVEAVIELLRRLQGSQFPVRWRR